MLWLLSQSTLQILEKNINDIDLVLKNAKSRKANKYVNYIQLIRCLVKAIMKYQRSTGTKITNSENLHGSLQPKRYHLI